MSAEGVPLCLPHDWTPIVKDVERAYPHEGCGVVLKGVDGVLRARPLRNAYDDLHARDPLAYPRTAQTAYQFDSREWLHLNLEAEANGERIVCIYHSHVDVGAYFSEEDRRMALVDGQPVMPGAAYLVLAVDQGKATGAKLFSWDGTGFCETVLPSPFTDHL